MELLAASSIPPRAPHPETIWAFDLGTNHINQTAEVACRSRFSFGMAGDGKKLYFYGAGFEIEVYDAVTLKYERTWDLNNDVTSAGMIVID